MAKLGPLVLAGIAVACCGWARAADLPPTPTLPEAGPDAESFAGWYLRGDIGGGIDAARPRLEAAPVPIAAPVALPALSDARLSPFGMVDVGAGYQFNSAFRADATFEYRGASRLRWGDGGYPWSADAFHADVSSFVGLVNGYLTPGAWYGFSPFIGAGVGLADNRLSRAGWQAIGPSGPIGGGFASGSKTSFAWAVMAGLDFDLTANLRLELSYRYQSYGAVQTGGDCQPGLAGPVESRNRLASNDIRFGVIYLLGSPAAGLN
jgi:opacity protein-like surface antigen